MAKTTSEAPTRLALPLIYMVLAYWLAGISNRFGLFLLTTLVSLLSVLAGEAFGLAVGASVDDMDRAMTVITVIALTMMLLGGYYVDNVPGFVSWAKYLSPFKYAFDASRELIFDRDVPCDGSGYLPALCYPGREAIPAEEVLAFLEVEGSIGFNAGMLIVLGLVPRYIAYLALRSKRGGKR
jgi:ABC-type multidrug transport system permease subunit